MNAVATPTYTPEDLLAMPDGKGFELVDGILVATNSSDESELGRRSGLRVPRQPCSGR